MKDTPATLGIPVCILAMVAVSCSPTFAEQPVPLKTAAVYWSMSGPADATGQRRLETHGKVTFSVELQGEERNASLARGGDGRAARFEAGGYLSLAASAGLKLNEREYTLAVRLRDPAGTWLYPILGSYGSDKEVSLALRAVDCRTRPLRDRNYVGSEMNTVESWLCNPDGPRAVPGEPPGTSCQESLLEVVWGGQQADPARTKMLRDHQPAGTPDNPLRQDVANAVLRVNFPVAVIGPRDWHDVVARYTGPKLQLFIDGVLVDEEFPVGVARQCKLPFLIGAAQEEGRLQTGFTGLIDHVAVWDHALSDGEIAALCGGVETVRQREQAILGPQPATMQYFRARGHNSKAGDCIPFWDAQAQTFRLFYLILRRNMHSKWDGGHGGLEIWQASTKDLKTWEHHPVTLPITEQWEAWNGTGAVAFLKGQYHWFYPTPHYEGPHGGIQHAVSSDGVHFTKTEPHPFLPGGDCEVFQTGDGLFHMIRSGPQTQAQTRPVRDKTLVAWVRLHDLDQGGGSILTIEHPNHDQFDALVYGECAPRRWMPGSNQHRRTPRTQQSAWPEETAAPSDVVQMALACQGNRGTLYRNGKVYASFEVQEQLTFPAGSSLMIGWRHTGGGPADRAYFRGRVLDARLYDSALKADQLAALKPHGPGGPEPLAWYDFATGTTRDRTGHFPDGMLYGKARVEDGALVLDGMGDYLKAAGSMFSQVRLTSTDLENWTEVPGPFITSDKHLAICPNVFRFGDWHYYICGSGVWRSRDPLGSWQEHRPLRLDNLGVPKTAAFGKDRRIYAGFLSDGGWGGNEVLRELVQKADGTLGTRFVPELIPACGEPVALQFAPGSKLAGKEAVQVVAPAEKQIVEAINVPADYRLQMEVVPAAGVKSFGLAVRAGTTVSENDCELAFDPAREHVQFSKSTDSGGGISGGPGLEAVEGLERPFTLDLIVRHDLLDAEIGGFRAMTTRYWNPLGNRLRFFATGGSVEFRKIRLSPLSDRYEPYPGWRAAQAGEPLDLSFHLMHPGGDSIPGDPNAAFCLDGTYHLHYILGHPWGDKRSFSFVHITSPDMLHWTWHPTTLQPAFTGHGMFSGTGFITKEGRPAVIYHGQASKRNQIAIATDNRLSGWEKPYPIDARTADGQPAQIGYWDPDCFLIGDTYYAISGGINPPLMKSKDLKTWIHVGNFLKHDLPDVLQGEDISCGNFFRLGDKWMLLCISHPLGCRYYIGDWDARAEQFVPQKHGRMNWRREDQAFGEPWRDYFAPESVLTPDGRRVIWAWTATLHPAVNQRTLQFLPRELSLPADGILRIRPLRELEALRYAPLALAGIQVPRPPAKFDHGLATQRIAELVGDACELRVSIAHDQAQRKRFGFLLFSDGKGGGLPIILRPETGTLRVGTTEAPFSVADLRPEEDLQLRIFIDKYLVEVFANDRQAMVAACMDYRGRTVLDAQTFLGAPLAIQKLEIWRLKPTNQGFLEARKNRIWEPKQEN